jgi:hypothetical protein
MTTTRRAVALRTFLVECYSPGATAKGAAVAGARLRAAATEMRRAGGEVEYAGSLLVAEDEVVIHVFHARDAELVRNAVAATEVACERVVESIAIDLEWSPTASRPAHSRS